MALTTQQQVTQAEQNCTRTRNLQGRASRDSENPDALEPNTNPQKPDTAKTHRLAPIPSRRSTKPIPKRSARDPQTRPRRKLPLPPRRTEPSDAGPRGTSRGFEELG